MTKQKTKIEMQVEIEWLRDVLHEVYRQLEDSLHDDKTAAHKRSALKIIRAALLAVG
jgi:hypothetical protein